LLKKVQQPQEFREKLGSPLFGWGDTGVALELGKDPKNPKEDMKAVVDSLWIICMAMYGYLGLIACWTAMLLPAVRFTLCHHPRTWFNPVVAPAAAITVIVICYMIDNISNAMTNPALILVAGALAGVAGARVPRPTYVAFEPESPA